MPLSELCAGSTVLESSWVLPEEGDSSVALLESSQDAKKEEAAIPIKTANPLLAETFQLVFSVVFFFSIFIIAPKQCFKNRFYSNKIFEKKFFSAKKGDVISSIKGVVKAFNT